MGQTATLNGAGAQCKPKKETIRFILNYSRALSIQNTSSGIQVELIRN